MMVAQITRDAQGRVRQKVSIQRLLEWAFADECAQVDFEDAGTLAAGYGHMGNAGRMADYGALGCRIKGGGRSWPDADADLVASAVACLPEGCGGRRMAVQIAELARTRRTPSLFEGQVVTLRDVPCSTVAVLGCGPMAMTQNQHGVRAATEVVGREIDASGRKVKRFDVLVCPVVYDVPAPAIHRARRNYLQWRLALFELRMSFQTHNNMSRWVVTNQMPDPTPWQKVVDE